MTVAGHSYASFPQQVARANEILPHAQAEQHAGPHYPCQDNSWDPAAFDAYHTGGLQHHGTRTHGSAAFPTTLNTLIDYNSNNPKQAPGGGLHPETGFYNTSLNRLDIGNNLGLAPQLLWPDPLSNTYGYDQPIMPTTDWTQPISAFQPNPAPAVLTVPVPPTTDAASIRCPEGCPETFGRNEEMRRHMKKHGTPRFKCPIYDCPMTFYRKDKLQDHAKKGHGSRASLNIR
ncbi:hypothetical protein J4E90_008493 [Alternaria incomplexa]|uniref:uncharacterized protein n=1 Tax=Alternaria incomplexa TaxID=1187928 RepID=UPI00221EEAB1|nr:uncharacterized protein J4E90_008493 [Alternaria incomplexa]KAI4908758.1 hypothetical protein J4E90_008493 [Alternaria incomplexa]